VLRRIVGWWVAAARLFASIGTGLFAVVLLATLFVGLVLMPVGGLGVPIVGWVLTIGRAMADLHRREAGRVLGAPVPAPRRVDLGEDWSGVRAALRDLQTGREVVWLGAHGAAGVVLAVLAYLAIAPLVLLASEGSAFLFRLPVWVLAAIIVWTVPRLQRMVALLARTLLGPSDPALVSRVEELTESRAATVDAQAAELRRIERDLHDGAQARLAALSMNLGMAEEMVARDPAQAAALLTEARESASTALSELRDLVRGIHPPVLADRGLDGAVKALAMSCPFKVDVTFDVPGRPPAPVESAAYFAVAECLANAVKYSAATTAWIQITHEDEKLHMIVGDDGVGGAVIRPGGGLYGIERRLAAFDGTLTVVSPSAGPTTVIMELPCESSSLKTTPSSGTA
jgi:signal transduction histidine kinase